MNQPGPWDDDADEPSPAAKRFVIPVIAGDEGAVAGALLTGRITWERVRHLRPSDFNDPAIAAVWSAAGRAAAVGLAPIAATITAMEPATAALAQTLARVPTTEAGAIAAANRLTGRRRRSEAVRILEQGLHKMKAHAAGRNPHEANWETDISDIAAALEALGGTPATITGDELTARVATLLSQDMPPVKTGIARLDEFLGGGLQAGTLLAIGGETRGDKTTLISTISGNLDDLGVAHLVISLDRTADEFGAMKLARRLGMGLEELRKNGAEAARLTGKLPPQGKGCRLLHAPGISIEEISAEARHQAKQHGARVLMLDTMQLVGGRQGRELEEQHMARVAEGLRSLVQNLRISGIVTVQMDQMGQVWRRAGAIAHTASAFLVLNRDRSQDGAWLENHGNSMGDEADIGTVDSPSLRLNRSGPHFQSE